MNWSTLTDGELMRSYCALMAELRRRGVVRSSNNPIADYTESLVARSLNLTLESKSNAGYDGVDAEGVRYQIKGRRLTAENCSTQLSTIRNLDNKPFDQLAAVMYSQHLDVLYAALIPVHIVREHAKFSTHSNGHIFLFKKSVLVDPGVQDITTLLKQPD